MKDEMENRKIRKKEIFGPKRKKKRHLVLHLVLCMVTIIIELASTKKFLDPQIGSFCCKLNKKSQGTGPRTVRQVACFDCTLLKSHEEMMKFLFF